jgi:hypothetical protein
MTIFTRYRHRVEKKFEPSAVTSDLKVMFLDQHSMKLGNGIFYTIEAKRQHMKHSMEDLPYMGVGFAFLYFFAFAYVTPISRKLYKEAGFSVVLGMITAYPRFWYYRKEYLKEVDVQYWALKKKFAEHPELEVPDSDDANKNFGMSLYANVVDDDDGMIQYKNENIFAGGEGDTNLITNQYFRDI